MNPKYFTIALTTSLFGLYGSAYLYLKYWPAKVQNEFQLILTLTQLVHLIVYVLVNSAYAVIYYIKHPFFEQYKVEKNPWPWENNREEWIKLRNKTLMNFVITFIIGILLYFVNSMLTKNKVRTGSEVLPTYWEITWQLIFCVLIEDLLFYTTHRLFHLPFLYRFHKQHHTYNITISISAEYAHPVEYIFGNIIPFMMGPKLLGYNLHLITQLLWVQVRVYKTLSAHSGYVFPWELFEYIPMASQAEFHSYHHSHNNGNYGSMLTFWDYVFDKGEIWRIKQQINKILMIYQVIAITGLISYIGLAPIVLEQFWPSLIVNTQYFYVLSLLMTELGAYIFVNFYYFCIYHLQSPFFEQFKVEKKPWPWEVNNSYWKEIRKDTLINFLYNQIIAVALIYIQSLNTQCRFDIPTFPSYFEIVYQILFFAVLEDFMFYWSHRFLHMPLLYPKIHKKHHLYTVTISISALYAHPIEFIFGNLLPIVAGPAILGTKMHMITFIIWMGISIHKTLSDHSGYSFPWEIYQYMPGTTEADFHSYHHSQNIGNYSSTFLYLDKLFGTCKHYDNYKQKGN